MYNLNFRKVRYMKKIKIKQYVITALIVVLCYLLQCTLLPHIALASIKPNLMIIVIASYGFMRGKKEGMFLGFLAGFLIDIQFGNIIGFYALIYMLIGYVNGLFQQMYFNEDIKLPLILISASEFVYGLIVYFLMFLMQGEFEFAFYLSHIIIPELIYTIVITLGIYPVILFINNRLEAEEKRSADKFVESIHK